MIFSLYEEAIKKQRVAISSMFFALYIYGRN
jgi:hypothetical protein